MFFKKEMLFFVCLFISLGTFFMSHFKIPHKFIMWFRLSEFECLGLHLFPSLRAILLLVSKREKHRILLNHEIIIFLIFRKICQEVLFYFWIYFCWLHKLLCLFPGMQPHTMTDVVIFSGYFRQSLSESCCLSSHRMHRTLYYSIYYTIENVAFFESMQHQTALVYTIYIQQPFS